MYDVVILDLAMPGFSGLDVVDALHKSGRIKEQKICILTASSAQAETTDPLLEKGVKMVLHKPMKVHELLETLEKVANN